MTMLKLSSTVKSSENVLDLQESQIVWLGDSSKPAEITLPKHLRAVAVVDAPFVYAVSETEMESCAELRSLVIEDIDVVNSAPLAILKLNY
ncbi:unnamed protein product [Gongylonema pulchrum]|uniref:Uncharacterized protein n=1 Tax=Gongylonema pulchrum TaxID=637853 RepID=A0A183DEB8_9BILA|nr:unnamed protein product [Gongylonema pulchrum]